MLSKKEYTELYKQYGLTGSEIAKRLESFGSSNAVEVTFIMTGTGYSLESKGVTVEEGEGASMDSEGASTESDAVNGGGDAQTSEFTSCDALSFLWNAKVIGREIPDNISLDLTISGTFVAGASMTYSVNFLTRGAPGIYLTRTEQERVIAEVDYAVNVNISNYRGNTLSLSGQSLIGPVESISGGFGLGGNAYRGFDNPGDVRWIGVGTGIGLTGGFSYGWGSTKAGWW